MEFEVTSEEIEIVPEIDTLSNEEIIHRCIAKKNIENINLGDKRDVKTDNPEEAKELEIFYEQLYNSLTTQPPIHNKRIEAVWDHEKQAVRVVKKQGKMDKFGYTSNKELYLEYFEALFLLEDNRLLLNYYGMPATLEQAYLLLIGEEASIKYAEYTVYSTLTRMGYILVKYRNCRYSKEITDTDCIWTILENEVQGKPIPDEISTFKNFNNIKCSMNENKNKIKNSISCFKDDELPESSSTKHINFAKRFKCNKISNTENCWQPSKLSALSTSSGHLDELKSAETYEKYQNLFDELEIIQLKTDIKSPETCRTFSINFDLYLHQGFRKSGPGPPIFRLIILDPDDKHPTHDEILMCYRQQLHPTRLIFITLSTSNQLSGFHCSFT
ncbi:uncharacterized protein LOC119688994 [Teleopsis dalmanni]|uniref:uncharacterized protein LOC119688994 n=1 Tax=Teleopsis dalmanni TaxID=139649 RepID=UPI0018CD3CBE|nr:uncharacterized protein LOC119688994 [Teleopsis dalmanni]